MPGLTYEGLSVVLNQIMLERGEWCGVPMPMPGLKLTVEPKNPWRDAIAKIEASDKKSAEEQPDGARLVNAWYSRREQCTIIIVEEADGTRWAGRAQHRNGRRVQTLLNTFDAADAWNIETEMTAVERLKTLIAPHLFKKYALTGMFLEQSRRSGLIYIFRRLAPTLVLSPNGPGDQMRIIAALCLHPIALYDDSHAGAMTPTDDVIAHLLLMRGDEAMFWRRSNQHAPHAPEAALL